MSWISKALSLFTLSGRPTTVTGALVTGAFVTPGGALVGAFVGIFVGALVGAFVSAVFDGANVPSLGAMICTSAQFQKVSGKASGEF